MDMDAKMIRRAEEHSRSAYADGREDDAGDALVKKLSSERNDGQQDLENRESHLIDAPAAAARLSAPVRVRTSPLSNHRKQKNAMHGKAGSVTGH